MGTTTFGQDAWIFHNTLPKYVGKVHFHFWF